MKDLAKHLPHYIVLFGILLAGFTGLVLFSYSKNFQVGIAIATAASYVSWGIVHHYMHKDLHFEVFVEYLAMAILGLTILFSLILR
jgi:hypothetical protein